MAWRLRCRISHGQLSSSSRLSGLNFTPRVSARVPQILKRQWMTAGPFWRGGLFSLSLLHSLWVSLREYTHLANWKKKSIWRECLDLEEFWFPMCTHLTLPLSRFPAPLPVLHSPGTGLQARAWGRVRDKVCAAHQHDRPPL